MKFPHFKPAVICFGLASFFISCEEDNTLQEPTTLNSPQTVASAANGDVEGLGQFSREAANGLAGELSDQHLIEAFANAVVPSECSNTEFNTVLNGYFAELTAFERSWYGTLSQISSYTPYFHQEDKQYFGIEGHLTNYAAKDYRNLEKFWNMEDQILLWGQHARDLQDKEVLSSLLGILYPNLSPVGVAYYTDLFYGMVTRQGSALQTSPLMALAGYASSNKVIVIGDGIVSSLADTGLEDKIVFSGILAHEWGHQIQFANYGNWYATTTLSAPEFTRLKELEADFFTAYYLTHKRGGTYNWKRVQQFLDLFYQIGDCGFVSSGHHGTPLQRMNSAYAGYLLADATMPKGKILSAEQVHAAFLSSLDAIVANDVLQ